jgi:hypothetical protein
MLSKNSKTKTVLNLSDKGAQLFNTMKLNFQFTVNPTKHLNHLLLAIFALVFSCGIAAAQPQQRPDWANMSPDQIQQMMQQRMMDNFRQQLAVTNDDEWNVIAERLSKVSRMKMEAMVSAGAGMMSGMRRGGGGQGPGFRGLAAFSQPDANVDNLQKALDGHATTSQVKEALAKLRDARKQKEAELAKAQADLRSVLTTRQEAALVLAGMLD